MASDVAMLVYQKRFENDFQGKLTPLHSVLVCDGKRDQ